MTYIPGKSIRDVEFELGPRFRITRDRRLYSGDKFVGNLYEVEDGLRFEEARGIDPEVIARALLGQESIVNS